MSAHAILLTQEAGQAPDKDQQKLQISHASDDLAWVLCNCPRLDSDLVNIAEINPKIYTDIRPQAGSDHISIFPQASSQSRDKYYI